MKRSLMVSTVVMALAIFAPQRSEAGFSLRLSVGNLFSPGFDVPNNLSFTQPGPFFAPGNGTTTTGVAYSAVAISTIGGLTEYTFLNFRIGAASVNDAGAYQFSSLSVSTNSPGSTLGGQLNLGYTTVRKNSTALAGDLKIDVTSTGFNLPAGGVIGTSTFSSDQNTIVNVTDTTYLTSNGAEFSTSGATLTQSGTGFVVSKSTPIVFFNPTYTLTTSVVFGTSGAGTGVLTNSGGVTTNSLLATPAPAAAGMVLSVLPLLGFAFRRRRNELTTALAV